MADNGNISKPNVLVLGGMGFIGRQVVHYLVKNDLCNMIHAVDKVIPQMGWLSPDHKDSMSKVQFKHANLINPKSVAGVFHLEEEENIGEGEVVRGGGRFDYVINCAAESKPGQTEAVYEEGIYKLSCNCAREAARQGVQRYVEISTALISASDKKAAGDAQCRAGSSEPKSVQARQKLEVEQELANITGLNYVILRPACVYGRGDRTGLTPRLVLGGIYKYLNETLQMLWTKDFRMNTVHVEDVARAAWLVCQRGTNGDIYHLADKTDTTQGDIADIVSQIFNVKCDYLGSFASNFAKYNFEDVLEEINEKHMIPWSEACSRDGIVNTPLTPYLDKELLLSKPLYVNGSGIESLGFQYLHPHMNKELLKQVLDDYITMGLYPRSLLMSNASSSH